MSPSVCPIGRRHDDCYDVKSLFCQGHCWWNRPLSDHKWWNFTTVQVFITLVWSWATHTYWCCEKFSSRISAFFSFPQRRHEWVCTSCVETTKCISSHAISHVIHFFFTHPMTLLAKGYSNILTRSFATLIQMKSYPQKSTSFDCWCF